MEKKRTTEMAARINSKVGSIAPVPNLSAPPSFDAIDAELLHRAGEGVEEGVLIPRVQIHERSGPRIGAQGVVGGEEP